MANFFRYWSSRAVEERDPRVLVTYAPLRPAEGRAVTIGVSARVDPSLFWADLYALDQAFYGEPRSVTARLTYEW